jgi:hypothetical protein
MNEKGEKKKRKKEKVKSVKRNGGGGGVFSYQCMKRFCIKGALIYI